MTADEIYADSSHVTIQECKNAGDKKLPSDDDIKDGLFKMILFSNLERLVIDGREVTFNVQLKLIGNQINGLLKLPASAGEIAEFSSFNQLRESQQWRVERLNQEVLVNPKLTISIGGRNETTA